MLKRVVVILATHLILFLAASPGNAMDKLTVMISGGFSPAYRAVLPEFERLTGIAVTTLSGASQGKGPKTIKSQLEQGAEVDVVIMSKEGLSELIAAGRIAKGSEAELGSVPLAAAVRKGAPKPDVSSVDALKQTLLNARQLVMPASTGGIYMTDVVFPKLGIVGKVALKMVPRGTDSTDALAAGEADLAIGPVSEIISQPGVDLVAPLPDDVQLVQMFTASIVNTAHNPAQGKKLIDFLTSDAATTAIKNSGMLPANRPKP
jgi:molybdate transport system substrate-binding protein